MLKDSLYKVWRNNNGEWGLEILKEKYKGLVVHIKEIELKDETNQLMVDYNVLYMPGHLSNVNPETDREFVSFMGATMNDVVEEAINVYKMGSFSWGK